MEYILSLSTQMRSFLFSLGFGLIIGMLYDILRVIRLCLFFSKTAVFITDFLFSVLSAIMTFLFCLCVSNGEVRLYLVMGEIIGFSVFYFSFGAVAVRFSEKTVKKIGSILKRIFSFIFSPFIKLFAVVSIKCTKIRKKVQKKAKNTKEFAKRLLQK